MNRARQTWPDIVVAVVTSIGCAAVLLWLATADPLVLPGGGLAAPGWAAVWAVAAVLLSAAVWLSASRAPAHGVAGLVALVAWMGPLLAATPQTASAARAAGYAAGVLAPAALTTMLVLPKRREARAYLGAAWAASLLGAVLVAAGYDPLRDPTCSRYCVPLLGPGSVVSQVALRGVVVLLVVGALVAGLRAVLVASGRISYTVAAAVNGAAVILTWVMPLPYPWHREDVAAACVLAASALVTADEVALLRRRQAARSAAAALLADPQASLKALESLPRDALTGAERLALGNAQLTVRLQVDSALLRESRRRIVERADDERHRIGRELHDGVQQRVVGTMLHVGALTATADDQQRRRLDAALALMRTSLAPLRAVTRRGVPPLLDSDGLATALRHRAADAPGLALALDGDDTPRRGPAARAAYIVVDALLDAAAVGPRALAVAIGDASVLVRLSGGPPSLPEGVRDRVLAAGGEVLQDGAAVPGLVEVRLPCGS